MFFSYSDEAADAVFCPNVPLHPVAAERIHAYLEASSHDLTQTRAPLFKPLRGQQTGAGITANGTHALVGQYAKVAGIEVIGLGVCMVSC